MWKTLTKLRRSLSALSRIWSGLRENRIISPLGTRARKQILRIPLRKQRLSNLAQLDFVRIPSIPNRLEHGLTFRRPSLHERLLLLLQRESIPLQSFSHPLAGHRAQTRTSACSWGKVRLPCRNRWRSASQQGQGRRVLQVHKRTVPQCSHASAHERRPPR